MKKIEIKNCVSAENVVITTYPQWSDYGCLTNALEVVVEEDGKYVKETYITEDLREMDCYDVVIVSWGDILKYKEYVKAKDVEKMKENIYLTWDYIRDNKYICELEVVRGRKYPKGLTFTSTKATKYDIPGTYGHESIYYIDGIDSDGNRVHINCENVELLEVA